MPTAIRTGTPPARRTAARTRSAAAFAVARPPRTPAVANRIARRTAFARTARVAARTHAAVIFSSGWWSAKRHLWRHRWRYHHHHSWWYWWGWSTWDDVHVWVDYDWDEGWEYEYDDNVVFDDEVVFINEEPVATAEDYVEIGQELAEADEPEEDASLEWRPLGVFLMATSETDPDPRMMIQLALSKDGRVGGTYHHVNTQNSRAVLGSLDMETQRIAFTIGDKSDDVCEVGLESLTRDEAPMWVHFQNGRQTQTWTLIRLEAPPAAETERKQAEAAEPN